MARQQEKFNDALVGFSFFLLVILGWTLLFLDSVYFVGVEHGYWDSVRSLIVLPGILILLVVVVGLIGQLEKLIKNAPESLVKSRGLMAVVGALIVLYYGLIDAWVSVRVQYFLSAVLAGITNLLQALLGALIQPLGFLLVEVAPLAIGVGLLIVGVALFNRKDARS